MSLTNSYLILAIDCSKMFSILDFFISFESLEDATIQNKMGQLLNVIYIYKEKEELD